MVLWVTRIRLQAKPLLLQLRVAIIFLIGGRVFWHSEALIGPSTQVNPFASCAAKGTVGVLWAEKTGAATGGALHLFGLGGWLTHLSQEVLMACALSAKRHFKGGVFFVGNQLAVGLLLHEPNDDQQPVTADLGCEV